MMMAMRAFIEIMAAYTTILPNFTVFIGLRYPLCDYGRPPRIGNPEDLILPCTRAGLGKISSAVKVSGEQLAKP